MDEVVLPEMVSRPEMRWKTRKNHEAGDLGKHQEGRHGKAEIRD